MEESVFGFFRILFKGLEGQSPSLDMNLSAMRSHMMNSDDDLPKALVEDIEQNIRVLELERQESCQDFLDVINEWRESLVKVKFDSEQELELNTISNQKDGSISRLYQFPSQLQILLSLQKIASDLQSGVSLPSCEDDNSGALKKVTAEIINLLQQIKPSESATENHKQLLSQLESCVEIDKLPIVICEISKLVESALSSKGEDFSSYLQGLNKQLSEVQEYILQTQNIDTEGVEVRKSIDEQVRKNVESIQDSVDKAEKVEILQEQLSGQLSHIVSAMDTLKTEDKKRESNLQASYDALKERVSVMEAEAEKVQEFIDEERKQARRDALTNIPNRTAYNEIMAHQMETVKRYKTPLSIVVCDLDHFKQVNDTYGHLAGDKVLSLVAKILCKGTRASDFVTRYGGEEFAIIMPSTEAKKAAQVMDKIRRLICNSPFNFRGEPISISMSFGVSDAIENDTIESLFSRADAALYVAKKEGRNRVEIA